MEILWISDWFLEELNGGAEQCDAAAIEFLQTNNFIIKKCKSKNINIEDLHNNNNRKIIFSNWALMDNQVFNMIVNHLIENKVQYFIYEHDMKWCLHRNVFNHGKSLICDCFDKTNSPVHMLYFYAKKIFCQTKFHNDIFDLNSYCDHISLGSNFWTLEQIELMNSCKNNEKNDTYVIFNSPYYHKNTIGATNYANENNIKYKLISDLKWEEYIELLSKSKGIIFFPKLTESASRLVFEAKFLGCEVITNKLTGYTHEEWWKSKDVNLENIIDNAKQIFISEIIDMPPKISIFCTTYNAENFINGWLENVTSFDFEDYEIVIYDGGSNDKTTQIINDFPKKSKIRLYKSMNKIGIYEGWNKALSKCKGDIVINMNSDDRFSLNCLNVLYEKILENDFVYSDSIVTNQPNETFEKCSKIGELNWPKHDKEKIKSFCYGGHYPMWNKNLLFKTGLFDTTYKSAGDWLQWILFSENNAKFFHVNEKLALYYFNPNGLSTSSNGQSTINIAESSKILQRFQK